MLPGVQSPPKEGEFPYLRTDTPMPKLHLTERAIAHMPAPDPTGKQVLHWDTDLKGFAVLCSGTTATKTYVVQRDLPNKKTRRLTVAAVNEVTLDKARDLAADMLLDLRLGVDPKRKDMDATLSTILESYLAARRDLSPESVKVYRQIENYLEPWLQLPLRTISADMIEARHGSLGTEIGGSTANGVMRTFRALWNFYAERMPDLPPNPVKRLKRLWFAEPRRTRMIPAEKLPEFYRAVRMLDNKVACDLFLLLMFTGLRKGETSSLRWDNIDLRQRTITLPAEKTKAKRALVLPMSDFVHALLVKRRALGNAKFVFPGYGKSGHLSDLGSPIKAIAERTGIIFSCHDLRRGFSTIAESVDVSMASLKMLLNHAPSKDVTAGYIVIGPERLRASAQRIADRLQQLCGIVPPAGDNIVKWQVLHA
jgi:integrase